MNQREQDQMLLWVYNNTTNKHRDYACMRCIEGLSTDYEENIIDNFVCVPHKAQDAVAEMSSEYIESLTTQ